MAMPTPDKPYALTFENRGTYGYFYVAGDHDSYDVSKAYWTEIAEQLHRSELDKVLIVEDIAEQAPIADIFNLVTELGDLGFKGIKIAFVDRYLDHLELNDFGALVGKNRGLDGRAFNDEELALEWLEGNE